MATLHVHLPGSGVVPHELTGKKTVSIGWDSDNVIAIKDASVSRHHAEIICEGESYKLRDLGSANKCWLNGVAVAEAPLHDGNSIRFGNVETVFRIQPAGSKMELEATPRGRLILNIPSQGETVHRCEGSLATIGWKSDNAIRIEDPSISGHHAQLILIRGKYRLKDLDSTNKTLINGHSIIEAELNDGDRVRFGAVEGVFKVEYRINSLPGSPEADDSSKALASQIQEQQTRIDALLKERDSLDAHNKQLSTQLQETTARIEKAAVSERGKAEAQLREFNDKIAAESARAAEAEQAFKAKAAEREKTEVELREKIAAETERAAEAEQALQAAHDADEQLARQLCEAQALIENLRGDQTGDRQKIIEVSNARDAALQAKDRLSDELNAALASLDAGLKERDTERQKGIELSKELAKAEENAITLKTAVAALEEKLTCAAAEQKAADTAASEWEAKFRYESQRAATLDTAQEKAQNQILALTQERDALNTTCNETQKLLDLLTQERDALKSSAVESQSRINALKGEVESPKHLSADAQSRIDAITKERDTLKSSASATQTKIDALTRECDALKSFYAEAQTRINTLIEERDAIKTAYAETQSRINSLFQGPPLKVFSETPIHSPAPERDAVVQIPAIKLNAEPQRSEALAKAPVSSESAAPSLPKPPALALSRNDSPTPPVPPPASDDPKASLIRIATPIVPPPVARPATRLPRLESSTTLKFEVDGSLLKNIVETAPEALNQMRRCLHAFIKNQVETHLLDQLLADLHQLTEQTSKANLTAIATLSLALESLIDDLLKIPGQINPSSLRTVSQSIDFLVTLLDEKNLFRTREPYLANIIAVDDDADARKTIRGAIEMVNLKVVCAEDSKTTLAVVIEKKFDLVFIDVGLPDMNGFELCTRLRKLPDYKKTPVVFITGAVTVQNRVQSSLSGGNDFIAKPFNLLELGVKALIWIFKGQLGMV